MNKQCEIICKRIVFVLFVVIVFVAESICQCTIFSLTKNKVTVYGQNLDWNNPVTGYVIINKRGVTKCILHWKGQWPAANNDVRLPVKWKSKFGSVTFTYLGRDFIEGGMNEVGLMVDEASLLAKYPPDDGRPGISCGQWMQYQLDNYETVAEVLNNLSDLRPDGEEWHYLISDRYGNSCAIEYLDGRPNVYQGDSLKFPILTNTTYSQAMSHIPMDKAFGGNIDIAEGTDSYGRFINAAILMQEFEDTESGNVEYAFHILSEVSNESTRRSVVYDSENKKVLWKSEKNNKIKWIDMNTIDFSKGTSTLMVDSDIDQDGNVNQHLIEYDSDILRKLLSDKFTNVPEATINLLKRRGYILEEIIEYIIEHPVKLENQD